MCKRDLHRALKEFTRDSLPWDPSKEPWVSNSAEENKGENEPVELYDTFNAPKLLGLWEELRLRPALLNQVLSNPSTVRREAERYNQLQKDIVERNQNGFAYFYWNIQNPDEPPLDLEPSYQTRIMPLHIQKEVLVKMCNDMRNFLEVKGGYDMANLSNGHDSIPRCCCYQFVENIMCMH